jgi:membrane-associated phospholipid phosphatase
MGWLFYFKQEQRVAKLFCSGFFTLYAIGFIGYTLVPALGPHLDPALAAQFHTPLTGGWLTAWNDRVVANGSNRVDVFPSLHCAATAFLLGFDARHAPHRFRIWLLPCAGLWVSTIYLRYHYVVDVIAGFILAAAALWMTKRLSQPALP